jgi:phosphoribosylformylglycinamidine synthase
MDAKRPGDVIYLLGATHREMGGSQYYAMHGHVGDSVPVVRPERARPLFEALSAATAAGLVRACHDCSDGGLAVAAAEMAFAGGLGLDLYLTTAPAEGVERDDEMLFSESHSRFIVEVACEDCDAFEAEMNGAAFGAIGRVVETPLLTVRGREGDLLVQEPLDALKEAWQKPLRW